MSNTGMVKSYPTGYYTDKRFILNRAENSKGENSGILYTYDPTADSDRWGYVFSFSKYMKFDWLYAN